MQFSIEETNFVILAFPVTEWMYLISQKLNVNIMLQLFRFRKSEILYKKMQLSQVTVIAE